MDSPIAFIHLQAQRSRLGRCLGEAIEHVIAHGRYILEPEVEELERRLADFSDPAHFITCANGTDAIYLCLLAEGVGPGDAVFVPAFSFVATAEVAVLLGAIPIFVDVLADTFNMDPESLGTSIGETKRQGLRPRAVIAVDLFGLPADYDHLVPLARDHGLTLLAHAAQSFGASLNGRRVGTLADFTMTSFYPSKLPSGYGDGGLGQGALVRSPCYGSRFDFATDRLR